MENEEVQDETIEVAEEELATIEMDVVVIDDETDRSGVVGGAVLGAGVAIAAVFGTKYIRQGYAKVVDYRERRILDKANEIDKRYKALDEDGIIEVEEPKKG